MSDIPILLKQQKTTRAQTPRSVGASIIVAIAASISLAHVAQSAVERGDIVDRNGVVLATTTHVPSVFANPQHVRDPVATAQALSQLLPGVDEARLASDLASPRQFVWVARHVSSALVSSVMARALPGVGIRSETARRYPQGSVAAHVVGFADFDGTTGESGAELYFNERLNTQRSPVQLSIDSRLQSAIREELAEAVRRSDAKGGAAVLLDAQTSEILALVSLPDFDPGDRASIWPFGFKDKVTSDVYEMAGIFEIYGTALALEERKLTLATVFNTKMAVRVGSRRLVDDEPAARPLSVTDIFARSSLVGAVHIADSYTPEDQHAFLTKLGLLDPIQIELGQATGEPTLGRRQWGSLTRTTIGYGYGLAVTPLHAAVAATAIINGGVLRKPTLTRVGAIDSGAGTMVVSPSTSAEMRVLLREVVANGTGHAAFMPGLIVGGKTGTSLKLVSGKYDKERRTTWFFGGFPMEDTPRYTILVMLDEPRPLPGDGDHATAEWNVVPAAGRMAARVVPVLGTAGGT